MLCWWERFRRLNVCSARPHTSPKCVRVFGTRWPGRWRAMDTTQQVVMGACMVYTQYTRILSCSSVCDARPNECECLSSTRPSCISLFGSCIHCALLLSGLLRSVSGRHGDAGRRLRACVCIFYVRVQLHTPDIRRWVYEFTCTVCVLARVYCIFCTYPRCVCVFGHLFFIFGNVCGGHSRQKRVHVRPHMTEAQ